jgi:hypothetical protein
MPSLAIAQSHADTAALVRAVTELIVKESSRPGDHGAPFVRKERVPSSWNAAVAAELRSRNPNLMTAPDRRALHLAVDEPTFEGDTVRVVVSWSRCTGRTSSLNYWSHRRTYFFFRSETGWRTSEKWELLTADGHC